MGHKHKETVYHDKLPVGVFDTHAHLYDAKMPDLTEVLTRSADSGVDKILIPADSLETSVLAVRTAVENNGKAGVSLWAAVGVHPHEASSYNDEVAKGLISLIENRKENLIPAIGEIGLDYYYDLSPRDIQREVFKKQILLAKETDLPFILHERDATGDCLEILTAMHKAGALRSNPGVCHCCSMSWEAASFLIKMGFYIGFDGPLTFKNNRRGVELAQNCPLERIVVETDSPYLTPEPNRGKTNEPCFVPFVVDRLAEIKGCAPEEMAKITSDNGMALYELQ